MKNDTRFTVVYHLHARNKAEAEHFSEKIGIEQSVEMPLDTVPGQAKHSLPELKSVEPLDESTWQTSISYPASIVDGDPTQLLNVLFGNISLLDGIQIMDVSDEIFTDVLKGPAFGIKGIRELLGVPHRPLGSTALKPVGLSAHELSERAFLFSESGIDIIKDDHGLANQQPAPFHERVSLCVNAVRRGEQKSGKRTLYFPNITASPQLVFERFYQAAEAGADGVLVCPQLTGLETLHNLAKLKKIPVMAHPSFSGSYIRGNHGFSITFYYGKLWRAIGADSVIYPNAGGRFLFSADQCKALNKQMKAEFCDYKPSLPTPGGGMNLETLPKWIEEYGHDTLFLIGGSLYRQPGGIKEATRKFQKILDDYGT
jgi:ribulose-bisphosphate carboxylase large chain